MKKQLYGIVAVATALSAAFGLILKTKGLSLTKAFEWRIENLDVLPEEYESDFLAIFRSRGHLCLKTNLTLNVLEIHFRSECIDLEKSGKQANINGTVTFKNSTNYVFGEVRFRKTVLAGQKNHLLTVNISNVIRKDSLSEVFEMLNNCLVLDFYILFTTARSTNEN